MSKGYGSDVPTSEGGEASVWEEQIVGLKILQNPLTDFKKFDIINT